MNRRQVSILLVYVVWVLFVAINIFSGTIDYYERLQGYFWIIFMPVLPTLILFFILD